MSSKKIVLSLRIGHQAHVKKVPVNYMTHDWELLIQGINNKPLDGLVEKMICYLHPSFSKPKRVLKHSPYQIVEMGYGNFIVAIDIFFKTNDENHRQRLTYELNLQKLDIPTYENQVQENITFNNVSSDFRKRLLAAGAVEVADHNESSVDEKIEIQKPPGGAKTKPRSTAAKVSQSSSGNESSTSRKTKHLEPKKEVSSRTKEVKATDEFKNIFGEILYTGQDSKPKKSKSEDKTSRSSSSSKDKKSKHSESKHKKPNDDKRDKPKTKSKSPKHKEKKSSHKESRKDKKHKSPEKSSSQVPKKTHKEKDSKKRQSESTHKENTSKKLKTSSKSKEEPQKLKKSELCHSPKKTVNEISKIKTPTALHDGISPKRSIEALPHSKSSSKKRAKQELPSVPKSPQRSRTPVSPVRSSRSRSLSASISSSSPESTSKKSRIQSISSASVNDAKSCGTSSSGSSYRSRSSSSESSSSSSSSDSMSPAPRSGGPLEALLSSRGLEKSDSPERVPSRNGQRSTPSEGHSSWRDDRSPIAHVPTPKDSRESAMRGDSHLVDPCTQTSYLETLGTLQKLIMEVFATKHLDNIQDIVDIVGLDPNTLEINESAKEPFLFFDLRNSSKDVIHKLREHFRI